VFNTILVDSSALGGSCSLQLLQATMKRNFVAEKAFWRQLEGKE